MRDAVRDIIAGAGPAALLRTAGYDVTEVVTPKGVMLLVHAEGA